MAIFFHRNSLTRPVIQWRPNHVGIQPSTQATKTQSPSMRKFTNMDPHSAPGALSEGHKLRFCSSPNIRVLGCVATPTNASWDPSWESEMHPRRRLPSNTLNNSASRSTNTDHRPPSYSFHLMTFALRLAARNL